MSKPGRFDYVRYDATAQEASDAFKRKMIETEAMIETLKAGRYKALALTALEECFMHIGKAIRDELIERSGDDEVPLQDCWTKPLPPKNP